MNSTRDKMLRSAIILALFALIGGLFLASAFVRTPWMRRTATAVLAAAAALGFAAVALRLMAPAAGGRPLALVERVAGLTPEAQWRQAYQDIGGVGGALARHAVADSGGPQRDPLPRRDRHQRDHVQPGKRRGRLGVGRALQPWTRCR